MENIPVSSLINRWSSVRIDVDFSQPFMRFHPHTISYIVIRFYLTSPLPSPPLGHVCQVFRRYVKINVDARCTCLIWSLRRQINVGFSLLEKLKGLLWLTWWITNMGLVSALWRGYLPISSLFSLLYIYISFFFIDCRSDEEFYFSPRGFPGDYICT